MDFIPASPCSFISQMKNSEVTFEDMDNYLSKYTPAILHCCYEDISSEKSIYKLKERVQRTLDILNEKFPKCNKWIDSAGFQIANGKFRKEILDDYIDIYYDMISSNNGFDNNFILDLPPSTTFNSWKEVEEYNDRSYKLANSDKGIFVFHTHNWDLYEIWNRLFDKYNEGFEKFSIGGVAGGLGTERIIVYALLFRIFIEKMLQTKRKNVDLHILGASAASPTLMFLFNLFRQQALDLYDISINITNDQSQHARLSQGRKFSTIYNGIVYSFDWFSKNLHMNFNGTTREEFIKDELNRFAQKNNISVMLDNLYNDDDKTNMTMYNLMCMYDIENYIQTQQIISESLSELISTYRMIPEEFYMKCLQLLKRLNGGRISKNIKKEAASIIKFLDILCDKNLNRVEMLLKQNTRDLFSSNNILF